MEGGLEGGKGNYIIISKNKKTTKNPTQTEKNELVTKQSLINVICCCFQTPSRPPVLSSNSWKSSCLSLSAGMTGVHCHAHYEKGVLKRCGSANLALSCLAKSGSCFLLVAQCQLDFAHQHTLAKGALWNVVTIQF